MIQYQVKRSHLADPLNTMEYSLNNQLHSQLSSELCDTLYIVNSNYPILEYEFDNKIGAQLEKQFPLLHYRLKKWAWFKQLPNQMSGQLSIKIHNKLRDVKIDLLHRLRRLQLNTLFSKRL